MRKLAVGQRRHKKWCVVFYSVGVESSVVLSFTGFLVWHAGGYPVAASAQYPNGSWSYHILLALVPVLNNDNFHNIFLGLTEEMILIW
jgi:hypothetical protein